MHKPTVRTPSPVHPRLFARTVSLTVALSIALVAMLAVGCGAPAEPTEPAADAGTAPTVAAVDTPAGEAEAPTEAVSDEPTVDTDVAGTEASPMNDAETASVATDDVRVTLPEGIADAVVVEAAPAEGVDPATGSASGDVPDWAVLPAHVVATFPGYPITEARHAARLRVLDTSDYVAANPSVGTVIDELEELIGAGEAPTTTDTLPLLPPLNAMSLIQVRPAILPFADGQGVRFLSMYGQAQVPLTNEELFYSFQGLTSDGSRYVSLIMPVRTDSLPDSIDLASWTFPADYDVYTADTLAQLDGLTPSAFTPDLDALDAMVAELVVTGSGG